MPSGPGQSGAAGGGVPIGSIVPFSGFTAPANWFLCNGQQLSRATYAGLFATLAILQSGDFVIATPVVTNLADTSNMRAGMLISAPLAPIGARILTVDSPTQITMDGVALGSGLQQPFNVTPFGYGDNMFTFNVPDLRARSPLGVNDGGIVGLSNRVLGDVGGEEAHALTDLENGAHLHGITVFGSDPVHSHAPAPGITNFVAAPPVPSVGFADAVTSLSGAGTPHNTMHPFQVVNFIIRAA